MLSKTWWETAEAPVVKHSAACTVALVTCGRHAEGEEQARGGDPVGHAQRAVDQLRHEACEPRTSQNSAITGSTSLSSRQADGNKRARAGNDAKKALDAAPGYRRTLPLLVLPKLSLTSAINFMMMPSGMRSMRMPGRGAEVFLS
jgi:hypothetical protein